MQAQEGRAARRDNAIQSSRHRRMSDEELNASNRRTAWTIGIVVAVFLLIAAQSHNLGALFRLFRWNLY
jgi:hypothetical protein